MENATVDIVAGPYSPVKYVVAYSLHKITGLLATKCGVRHNIAKRFGARVRALRVKRNLSQQALAAKADLDRAFLSGIERGVENPTLFTIQAIADGLSVSIGTLTKGL